MLVEFHDITTIGANIHDASWLRTVGRIAAKFEIAAQELGNAMRTLMSKIEVFRNFQGTEFKVPVEVWSTPEGICARSLTSIFYRDGARDLLLLEADEDPQLDEREMGLAEDSLWVVRSFDPHVP